LIDSRTAGVLCKFILSSRSLVYFMGKPLVIHTLHHIGEATSGHCFWRQGPFSSSCGACFTALLILPHLGANRLQLFAYHMLFVQGPLKTSL
jgi:hypothetical protein